MLDGHHENISGQADLTCCLADSGRRYPVYEPLTGVAHVTEHVGSTAVPGLDAKPVIDVDVVIPDQTAVTAAIKALAAAGWQHQGDLGITGREAFLPPAGAVYHHLYVVVARSQPHRDHIDLRDLGQAE